jgi:hypothetical protein
MDFYTIFFVFKKSNSLPSESLIEKVPENALI